MLTINLMMSPLKEIPLSIIILVIQIINTEQNWIYLLDDGLIVLNRHPVLSELADAPLYHITVPFIACLDELHYLQCILNVLAELTHLQLLVIA
jgi:hypothetical protein